MLLRAHKIASVVYRLGFTREIECTRRIDAKPGSAIVVRALAEKRVYSELELESGRMSKIFCGDVIAGALGRRRALRGFSGDVPAKLRVGDIVQLLNRGGVIGVSRTDHKDLGQPVPCEVLGAPVRNGSVVSLFDARLPAISSLQGLALPPILVVSGTCMEAGKTLFLSELTQQLSKAGLRVGGGKLTGIACLRDLISLEDHGAAKTVSFLDAGHSSTVGLDGPTMVGIAKTVIGHLAAEKLDVILLELGDGVIGEYGVLDILKDPEVRESIRMHAFCAGDMVGAWGGWHFLKENGLGIDIFSGPATDNNVGVEYLRREFGVQAINAHHDPESLADAVLSHLRLSPDSGRSSSRGASR